VRLAFLCYLLAFAPPALAADHGAPRPGQGGLVAAEIGLGLLAASGVWATFDAAYAPKNMGIGPMATAFVGAPMTFGGALATRRALVAAGLDAPGRAAGKWAGGVYAAGVLAGGLGVGAHVVTTDPAPLLLPLPLLAISYSAAAAQIGRDRAARNGWTRAGQVPRGTLWAAVGLAGGAVALGLGAGTVAGVSKSSPGSGLAPALGVAAGYAGIGALVSLSGYLGALGRAQRQGRRAQSPDDGPPKLSRMRVVPLPRVDGGGLGVTGTW